MSRQAIQPEPNLKRVAIALLLGTGGGWVAQLLHLPLAWMIGAMLTITVAATAGLPVAIHPLLRQIMVAVLGVLLGSSFSPELLDHLADWSVTLTALVAYCAIGGGLSYLYFRFVAGYDRVTAYFAGMPGGLTEMILVGSSLGGDARQISLTHASRILIVIMILPFAFQILEGYEPASRPPPGPPLLALLGSDVAILVACGIIGFIGARALRIPAAGLVGPMALSAIAHLSGWTAAKPPFELIAAAQVVVGSAIGARFAGVSLALIRRALFYSLGGTAILVAVTLAFAFTLTLVTGIRPDALVLAFSPGGLAEMSLIALALSMDAAFVATHHIIRIFLIVVMAPAAFRLLNPSLKVTDERGL